MCVHYLFAFKALSRPFFLKVLYRPFSRLSVKPEQITDPCHLFLCGPQTTDNKLTDNYDCLKKTKEPQNFKKNIFTRINTMVKS